MPFTGSHAAAILPFGRWLPASALVIGSMMPDLPYYVPGVGNVGSHTIAGLVGQDLVLGLGAFLLWQGFVGRAVVALAPPRLSRRLGGYPVGLRHSLGTPRQVLLVLAALVLGGLTHLAWDSLTHVDGWTVVRVAWLGAEHGPFPGWRWVQLGSEIVALAAIVGWSRRWWRTQPETAAPVSVIGPSYRRAALAAIAVAGIAGAVAGAVEAFAQRTDPFLYLTVVGAGTWGGAAVIMVAAVWRLRR